MRHIGALILAGVLLSRHNLERRFKPLPPVNTDPQPDPVRFGEPSPEQTQPPKQRRGKGTRKQRRNQ